MKCNLMWFNILYPVQLPKPSQSLAVFTTECNYCRTDWPLDFQCALLSRPDAFISSFSLSLYYVGAVPKSNFHPSFSQKRFHRFPRKIYSSLRIRCPLCQPTFMWNINLYSKYQLDTWGKDSRVIRCGGFDSVSLKVIEQLYRWWEAINAWNALYNASYYRWPHAKK